ncbi:TIGR03564 family F420-dependent LLM class oxidoreductase [Amycolatopsis sp. NBC_00345]|uniref:TIGR03564 family F420-dependent LLM class oxidoreductase n=1 Tax=Amycolatopsis sp. NBC_00345 TaxID=2975955 RepID=UPI002E270649
MTIGITLPAGQPAGVDELIGQARQAADAGVGSVWFSQQPLSYDAIALAGLAGREVPGLAVGTSVVPLYPRHPLVLASAARTADAATGGRFTLGLGLGAQAFHQPIYGVEYPPPIRHLREQLTVLRQVFSGEAVDFAGETLDVHTADAAGAADVSIIVAAMGPQALRVTGELADGTLPFLAGPRTLAEEIVPTLTKAAERAGRPAPRIIAAVPVVVTGDVAAVRQTAAAELGFYSTIPSYQKVLATAGVDHAAQLALIGDEETVAAGVRQYYEAGATEVLFAQTGLNGTADRERTWRLAGALNSSGS